MMPLKVTSLQLLSFFEVIDTYFGNTLNILQIQSYFRPLYISDFLMKK